MNTYTYSYKSDSSNEIIGRVSALDLFEAQIKIAMIKKLSIESIQSLFEIKKSLNNEKDVRTYQH
jgi:predicted transcriptional regulator